MPLLLAAPPVHTDPPPEVWVAIILFGALCGLVPLLMRVAGDRKATRQLPEWARAQGLDLLEFRLVPSRRGPFSRRGYWTSVFRVTTKTAAGPSRAGWVCAGNFFLWGFGKPELTWDE
jgi:hypothetical protein